MKQNTSTLFCSRPKAQRSLKCYFMLESYWKKSTTFSIFYPIPSTDAGSHRSSNTDIYQQGQQGNGNPIQTFKLMKSQNHFLWVRWSPTYTKVLKNIILLSVHVMKSDNHLSFYKVQVIFRSHRKQLLMLKARKWTPLLTWSTLALLQQEMCRTSARF